MSVTLFSTEKNLFIQFISHLYIYFEFDHIWAPIREMFWCIFNLKYGTLKSFNWISISVIPILLL